MVEKVLQFNKERAMFWTLLAMMGLFVGLYTYFVTTTINNGVALEKLESEASALSLSLGSKEFEYISKRNSITLSLAHSLGFKDIKDKTYIPRNPANKVAYLKD